jgi:predicted SprT family Zn-dependent metalloprotease
MAEKKSKFKWQSAVRTGPKELRCPCPSPDLHVTKERREHNAQGMKIVVRCSKCDSKMRINLGVSGVTHRGIVTHRRK